MKIILTKTLFLSTLFLFSHIVAIQSQNIQLKEYLINLPITSKLGGSNSRPLATSEAFTFIGANTPKKYKNDFLSGNKLFNFKWLTQKNKQNNLDGLGPVFNQRSCSDCHINNGRGIHNIDNNELQKTFTVKISDSNNQPIKNYGMQLQDKAILNSLPEADFSIDWYETKDQYDDGEIFYLRKPKLIIEKSTYEPLPKNYKYSIRIAPAIIGVGLIDKIPSKLLIDLSDPKDLDDDGISGKVNSVWDIKKRDKALGRFGWKASVSNLENQNAIASFEDMGITNPILSKNQCLNEYIKCQYNIKENSIDMNHIYFDQINKYLEFLAVPEQRMSKNNIVQEGKKIFYDLKCTSCHVPTLFTVINNKTEKIHPFSDFLLHNMGEGLADNKKDFEANGFEWRTPPLWGIGLTKKISGKEFYLHDGRARNLEEAILWHGGEAKESMGKFRSLEKIKRNKLIKFLKSL